MNFGFVIGNMVMIGSLLIVFYWMYLGLKNM